MVVIHKAEVVNNTGFLIFDLHQIQEFAGTKIPATNQGRPGIFLKLSTWPAAFKTAFSFTPQSQFCFFLLLFFFCLFP